MRNSSKIIRSITESSMFVAIYLVFLLFSRFIIADLESTMFFLLPVPLIIYYYRNDLNFTAITAACVFLMSFLFISVLSALFIILPALLVGILYGYMSKKNIKNSIKLPILTLSCLAANLISTFGFAYVLGYNFIDDFVALSSNVINFLNSLGINHIATEMIKSFVIGLIPSFLILDALLNAYIIHILSTMLLESLRIKEKSSDNYFELSSRPIYGIIFIVLFLTMSLMLPFYDVNNLLYYICFCIMMNLTLILGFVMFYFFISWLALICYVKKMRALYILFVLISFITFPIFMVVGAIITFLDCSKKTKKKYNIEKY